MWRCFRNTRTNINNLRYADDTTLTAESKEELKKPLKVKEESEKLGLKLNTEKAKITVSGPITSQQIDGETMETVRDFIFLGSKITADGDCNHEIKRCLLLGRKAKTNLVSKWSRSVVSNSLWPHGLKPTGLLHPWDFPGKNTVVGCHFLLQGNFPTQGLNPGLLHCRQTLYRLSHEGSLDSILKNRDITLPTQVRLVKAMVFPVVMYGR